MSEPATLSNYSQEMQPYWRAISERKLSAPKCSDCHKLHLYPKPICPYCGSRKLQWVDLSGLGTIYSFTIVHRAPSKIFEGQLPYAVAIVALVEGPHIMSRIMAAPDSIRIGMPVTVTFETLQGGELLPVFNLSNS